jgi:hypothetical protein
VCEREREREIEALSPPESHIKAHDQYMKATNLAFDSRFDPVVETVDGPAEMIQMKYLITEQRKKRLRSAHMTRHDASC